MHVNDIAALSPEGRKEYLKNVDGPQKRKLINEILDAEKAEGISPEDSNKLLELATSVADELDMSTADSEKDERRKGLREKAEDKGTSEQKTEEKEQPAPETSLSDENKEDQVQAEKEKELASVGYSADLQAQSMLSKNKTPNIATFAATPGSQRTANSFNDLADYMHEIIRPFSAGPAGGELDRHLGSINTPAPNWAFTGSPSDDAVYAQFRAAMRSMTPEERENVVNFAACWCSIPDDVPGCPDFASTDGLVPFPTINVPAGRVRRPGSHAYIDVKSLVTQQIQTCAQITANTPKTCVEIPCVEPEEFELDVAILCVTAGIVNASANPEQIRQFLRLARIAYAHRINESLITRATTVGTTPGLDSIEITGVNDNSLHTNVLEAVAFATEELSGRGDYSTNQVFDVLLPRWVRKASLLDLARRNGNNIPLAQETVTSNYRAFNSNIAWVDDWQQLAFTVNGTPPPAQSGAWPTSIQALVYVPGNFAHLSNNVIDINTVYDSTLLATNRFTAQFVEQGVSLLVGCEPAWLVTIPTCPSGNTGTQGVACATDVDPDASAGA